MKVNLGSGQTHMPGWVNVDASPDSGADIPLEALEFIRRYGWEIEEVFLGRLLEHLPPEDAASLLRMLNERLPVGSAVTAVQSGSASLLEVFQRAGFPDAASTATDGSEPLPSTDDGRGNGQIVRATAAGGAPDERARQDISDLTGQLFSEGSRIEADRATGVTAHELLVRRIELMREALATTHHRLQEADEGRHRAVDALAQAKEEAARAGRRAEAMAAALPADRRESLDADLEARELDAEGAPYGTGPQQLPANSPVVPPAPTVHQAADADGDAAGGWKSRVRRFAVAKLPEGSTGREVAKAGLDTYREGVEFTRRVRRAWRTRAVAMGKLRPRLVTYETWLRGHRIDSDGLRGQQEWARHTIDRMPLEVLVLPGHGDLDATMQSLRRQSWPYWQAAVCAGDAHDGGYPDHRIRHAAPSGGMVHDAANAAVQSSTGEFVVLLRAGDVLAPDCLFTVASAVHQDPLLELVVWDDDLVAPDGARSAPRFRPSWSPEMLLGADYIGGACGVRRTAYLAAGGLFDEFGPHASWHLLLSLDLPAERVTRVSRVLSSTTDRPAPDPTIAPRVVQRHLDRRGLPATAELVGDVVRVRWTADDLPHVTVVIPTRHNRVMLSTCLPSLAATDYPAFDLVIVDNGGWSAENDAWYDQFREQLDLRVLWWTETPFNYSAVNNAGARDAKGQVLIFLNDDTELLDPTWMQELVGWARLPEIGVAGLQLIGPDDEIQHTGVILGLGGFADHIFEGTPPHQDSIFGRNDWYRNCLAVTGACLAIRREVYDETGGLDERFVLMGSDVCLGLDTVLRGYRNVCSPFGTVRHLEAATRGTNVPHWDFFMSYWRYNSWLFGGDPYFSPNISLSSRVPQLRTAEEPTPQQRVSIPLGRTFSTFRQSTTEEESRNLAEICRALPIDVVAVDRLHADNAEAFEVRTINWFIPDIDSPFYGGINTAFRIADELARVHGVENRFVVWGSPNEFFVRSALAAAFPALQHSPIHFYAEPTPAALQAVPAADAAIATLWVTAFAVAHASNVRRKFYLIQDFEPMFYPASTLYALAEESYRLGLYGLCNTDNLRRIYAEDYDGKGMSFTPAVNGSVFHAEGRPERSPDTPVTVFVYGRPGHWRNCWEMTALALEELKRRLGDKVRIVTAGAWATGGGAEMDVKRLGLLDYRATGELYRHCDVGLALTVSKHPSYLPLELMACGVPVVAFDNPWGYWILDDGANSLLAKRTVDGLVDRLEALCVNAAERRRMSQHAVATIAARHGDWEAALAPIYPYLCDPEGRSIATQR